MGPHAVPRRPTPVVVTIELRLADRGRSEFRNLLVRAYREWDEGPAAEPVHHRAVG